MGAGMMLAIQMIAVGTVHEDKTATLAERGLNRVRETFADIRTHHQTVHHEINLVFLVAVKLDVFFQT